MRRRVVSLGVLVIATAALSAAAWARPAISVITLHAGQSKKVGKYTVICTTQKLAKKSARIVLHPGYQVALGATRVRSLKASPEPTPTPTPTPAPTPTPTPTPPPPAVGTARSNPLPIGTANNAGD